MAYQCEFCGTVFEEPRFVTKTENLDGENGWWRHTDAVCPCCGSEDFFEADSEKEDESA